MFQRFKERIKTVRAVQNTGDNLKELQALYALADDTEVPVFDDEKNLVIGEYEICLKNEWLIIDEFDELYSEDPDIFSVIWEKL